MSGDRLSDHDQARHDFKNQLAIIRGFAEMLLADAAGGERQGDLEEIHKAALASLALLDRLYPPESLEPHRG